MKTNSTDPAEPENISLSDIDIADSRHGITIDRANEMIDLAGYTSEDGKLADLAFRLFSVVPVSTSKRPRSYRAPSWKFGVVGDPAGQFIVTPGTRRSTNPDVFPRVEPSGDFWFLLATRGHRLRLVCRAFSSVAVVRHITGSAADDPLLCSALERTFAAIEAGDWSTLRGADRSRCMWCDRPLTDERSRRCGYGPDCAGKYGLAYEGVTEVAA